MKLSLVSLHRHRRSVYLLSASGAAVASLVVVLATTYLHFSPPVAVPTLVILLAVVSVMPAGFADFVYGRWKGKIDGAVPRMLTDVTSGVNTGLSLTRSLELSADRDYGPLTAELKGLKAQLSWGIPFGDAMKSMMRRTDTFLARRTFQLLLEADQAGGRTEDLLDAIQKHTVDLQNIEKERKSSLRPYVVTTYIAFGVFLAISVLLVNTFFSQVLTIQSQLGAGGAAIFAGLGTLDLASVKQVFLEMALVEAVFGGLGAGKLGEGTFAAGFKHIVIMVVTTLIVFTTIVS